MSERDLSEPGRFRDPSFRETTFQRPTLYFVQMRNRAECFTQPRFKAAETRPTRPLRLGGWASSASHIIIPCNLSQNHSPTVGEDLSGDLTCWSCKAIAGYSLSPYVYLRHFFVVWQITGELFASLFLSCLCLSQRGAGEAEGLSTLSDTEQHNRLDFPSGQQAAN